MARYLVGLALSCIALACLWGCSSLRPQKKETVNAPIILEEDVTEKPGGEQGTPTAIQSPPGTETVSPGFGNQPTTPIDPASRPPRRIKFGDKKGWESLPDRPDAKQP